MLEVEYIAPDGKLIEAFDMADGMTLEQAARTICPDSSGRFPVPTLAFVGAKPAVRKFGDWNIRLSDTKIQFRQLVMGGGGGGSNPLQMIMQVALIALAAATTFWLSGAAGPLVAAGLSSTAAGTWAAVAGAGIMMLGTMLMGALFPQQMPQSQLGAMNAEQASPTYNINSSGNQARLYQQEPEGFGRMKIVPDFVSKTWTQYIDNDQIGYFVYGIGRGHYDIESLSFGETVFWRKGNFTESGYANSGAEQNIYKSVQLVKDTFSEPILCVGPSQETKNIGLEIEFPDGLCGYELTTEGNAEENISPIYDLISRTASLQVQAQKVDADDEPDGEWFELGSGQFSNNTVRSFSESLSFSLPEFGRWRIRIKNTSPVQPSDKPAKEKMVLKRIAYYPNDISIEIVEPGNPVTIFPDNVITSDEVNGQELFAPNEEDFTGAIGPYTTNPAGTHTNRLLFDFTFPQGVGRYNDKGELGKYTITWRIEYCRIDDFGEIISEWATLDELSIRMATTTPQRLTKTYNVQDGRYMARVIRTSDTVISGTAIMDNLTWAGMKAMLPGTYQYPITCIAISIKASNTLTQNASRQFSAIVTRKLPLYDRETKTWSDEVPTRSWAAAVSHVCKCEWGGRLEDASIDLDTLWAIDERLKAKNWFYDSYLDGPTLVWTLLCEMCQSQCVIARLVGPFLSFVEDGPNRQPSFALTPRNIVRSSFGVTYATWDDSTPDDVTLEYLDADYGFQQRDVTAKLPESESREPSSLDILGITDRSHAHKVAVAYAAHNRWQRIAVECQIEALGRIINKGDICTVAHPRFKNTCAGAIESWNEANLLVYASNDYKWPEDILENQASLYVAFTRQDGSIWGPCKTASILGNKIVLDSGDYSTLLLQGHGNPFEFFTSGIDRLPTTWTLYKAKEYQRLMVVDSVTSQDMLHYNIKLLNYDDRIYQYDDLPVPIWQGRGQLPDESEIGIPQSFRGIINNSESLTLTWSAIPTAQWYEAQISYNNADWRDLGRININQVTVSVAAGKVYARVRGMSNSLMGGWAYWAGNTLLLPPVKPIAVILEQYTGGDATIGWNVVEGASKYAVSLSNSGNSFYNAVTTSQNFQINPEIQQGGPYRNIDCQIVAIGEGGSSQPAILALNDPAPDAPISVNYSLSGNSIVLSSVSPMPSGDYTGYVFLKGRNASFMANDVIEMRQATSLPYIWDGLAKGVHYFRLAIKDAFFEITNNPLELNWSQVLTVEVS